MVYITKNNDKTASYVMEYVADEEADVSNLPTDCAPGSSCIVIESSNVYMLNNKGEWKSL